MQTELLAPAKNIEIANSAINCGADAVYIGSVCFGARKNASNSLEDIEELVNYAHKFYVKVYVTVNTIISDNELDEVKSLINKLYDIGVDAIIIQDMSIIEMAINGQIPPIPLHISTQCNNRTFEKVKFFNDIGIPRVVLARELDIKTIKNIHDENPNLELENFIHGALCVSYSGQCYLSQHIGGRSANKGECAQPCRKKYSLIDEKNNILIKNKHLLCLKDFNATKHIKSLVEAGVSSFKIEGRLKDEQYVKNVVGYYRQELDKYSQKTSSGKISLDFTPDINKTFNRGYTDYFLEKRNNCYNFDSPKYIGEEIGTVKFVYKNYFEIKLNKNIILNNQDGLCFDKTGERGCLINKIESNKIFPNKMPNIKQGERVYRNIDTAFEKSILKSNTKRQIGVKIKFYNGELIATDENNNTVKININETEKTNNNKKMEENFIKSFSKTGESDFYIQNIEIISELPFIPISIINEYRRKLFDVLMTERLKNYKREIQKPLRYTNYYEKNIDYRGNVHNIEAELFYKKCSSNVNEHSFESSQPKRKVELMRTKHCIKYALNMCGKNKELFLLDDRESKYPLGFDCKNCEMIVYNN